MHRIGVLRHHKYPFDYSASELGATAQFNPTRVFIDAMALVGLVTDRKRALRAWEMVKEAREHKGAARPPILPSRNSPIVAEEKKGV